MCWTELRYFSRQEFMPGADKSAKALRFLIDDIRHALGKPVILHCVWAPAGHAPKSYHYTGQAVDFHIQGLDLREQYGILSSFREIGGLGFYPEWNNPGWHADIRAGGKRLEWLRWKRNYFYSPTIITDYLYKNEKEFVPCE